MNSLRAVLLHGKPKKAVYFDQSKPMPHEANWFPWVREQLTGRGYEVTVPELPRPYDPNYPSFEAVLDQLHVDEETVLIGHSMGAGLLLRYMCERSDLVLAKGIMIAPWLDPDGNYGDLFNFAIDKDVGDRCLGGMSLFYSSQDDRQALESLKVISRSILNLRYRDIPEYGHYMIGNSMVGAEFPELLEEL